MVTKVKTEVVIDNDLCIQAKIEGVKFREAVIRRV
jgi:hypothetical protein